MSTEEKLNEEYRWVLKRMQELNKQRYEIFKRFKKTNPDAEIKGMRTPSIYHDLFGVDMYDENGEVQS